MPSGTIWGSFTNKSTSVARPYITWSYSQSISGNTSTIDCNLYFVRYDGYRSWNNTPKSFTITIDGSNYSSSQPFDIGPNSNDYIFDAGKTITHDSDGSKTINISASGYTGLSSLGNVSLSGSITFNDIPRASDFSISGNTLGSPITVSIDRASGSFTHTVIYDLPSGDRRDEWTGVGSSKVFTPPLSDAQYIPNSTSATGKITVRTYNGSDYLGYKTHTFTMYVPSSVKPTASNLQVSVSGTGRDNAIGKYIQSISKVTASFSRSTMYGASISVNTITVKRQSDGANSQTIGSYTGTTSNPVTLSGTYLIEAYVKDSRGRTDTISTTITVDAYSPPRVTNFSTSRSSSTTTSVIANVGATWTPLGTSNPTDISIVGVNNIGTSQTLYTLNDSTAGNISTTQTYTGQSDASSYTYTITVTDSFGKKATAATTVGTSFVELTIAKGRGIGVGKVWEQGALDVGGNVYATGSGTFDALRTIGGDGLRIYQDNDDEFMRMAWADPNRFYIAPYINDAPDWGSEFGYDYDNDRWYVDKNFRMDSAKWASRFEYDGSFSASNYILGFGQGYNVYSDNVGSGTAGTRLWWDTPDDGEFVIGPRAGDEILNQIRLRSRTTRIEGNGDLLQIKGSDHAYIEFFPQEATNTSRFAWIGMGSAGEDDLNVRSEIGHLRLEGKGTSEFWVGSDGTDRIWSMSVYNRTYGGSANMTVTTAGTLGRITSASKYKLNIQEIDLSTGYAERLLNIVPKKWFDKSDSERLALYNEYMNSGDEELIKEAKKMEIIPVISYYGLIAEDLVDLGLEKFVMYGQPDDNGVKPVEGIAYDRMWILAVPLLKKAREEIINLRQRATTAENEIVSLKQRVLALETV